MSEPTKVYNGHITEISTPIAFALAQDTQQRTQEISRRVQAGEADLQEVIAGLSVQDNALLDAIGRLEFKIGVLEGRIKLA